MNYRYTTNDNEQFIFVNNSVSSIIGFSTERNLNVLCDVTDIYMDGTFNVCPKFFTQLFTIHGLKDDVYIPLVFFLLPDKQKITYELAFKYLVDHCSLHGMTLAPVQVFIDFEIAIHMAVESVWPTSQIRGCRFHLAQSWWRKIQNLGLSAIYKDTSSENETGNFLKLFFCLPFLRPIEVIDCFTDELMAIRPTGDNRIEEFMDYVFDNYISLEASFPPSIWAQFSTTSNRTTNSCESFHSKLNSCFYSGHPNIFVFINELNEIEVQSETYIKCRSNGTKKSKKQQEKQIFLREEMSRYTVSTVYSITVALSLLQASIRDLCPPDNMPRPNNAHTTPTRKDIKHAEKNKNNNNIQAARLIKNTSNNSMLNPTDDNLDAGWTQNTNKRNHSDSSERKSPDPTSNNKNYKKLFITANRYEVLTQTEPANPIIPDSNEASCSSPESNTYNQIKPPPPIFVKGIINFSELCVTLTEVIGVDNFYCKSSSDCLKIQTANPEAYRSLIHFLKEKNAQFHTYQLKEDKPTRVVIRNIHPSTSTELIKSELEHRLFESYSKVPKQLLRDNANFIVLFKQDETNLKHVYNEHCSGDMSYSEFKDFCTSFMAASGEVLGELIKAKENIKRNPIIEPLKQNFNKSTFQAPSAQQDIDIQDSQYFNDTGDSLAFKINDWYKSYDIDKTYGPKVQKNGRVVLGKKEIKLVNNSLTIDDVSYTLTQGLGNLIFSKNPKLYTKNDLYAYKSILIQTSVHLTADEKKIKKGGNKYYEIIQNLFRSGGELSMKLQKHNLVYWNDPNELVESLKLLLASKAAGNTGVSNEIISIFEELHEAGIIKHIPNV
ncbi:hypothetical protein QTP88_000638 [Uroleucon formosanum]